MAIHYFTAKRKNLKLTQTAISFLYNETQNFENCTQTPIRVFTTKYGILNAVLKRPLVVPQGNTESNYLSSI